MTAGRPTKYKISFCDIAGYLDQCKDQEELPTKTGYALYINVSKRVIADWAEKYPKFLQALDKLMMIQENALTNKGLKGTYNSTISKMLLNANHGIQETEKREHSGQVKLLPPEIA